MALRYPTGKKENIFAPKGPTGPGGSNKSAGRRGSIGPVMTQKLEHVQKPLNPSGKVKPRSIDLETQNAKRNANSKTTKTTKVPRGYMLSSDGVVKY